VVQKKKRKGLEQEAEAVPAEPNGQSGAKQKKAWPLPDGEMTRVSSKKAKAKPSASLGGQRTSDMMKLLVS
jgi:hypothetical protein